jgi:hypothetical protein
LNKNLDEKYHRLALAALHEGLLNQKIPENSSFTKRELLEAFEYSGGILRENRSEGQIRIIADSVFVTCIRLARCLFFPQEARFIVLQGKEYTLDVHSQTESLRRNIDDLKKIVED